MIERIVIAVGLLFAFVSLVSSVTYYNVKRDELLKSAVESAIAKGIDPMSVRCAFGSTDSVCLVYAASLGKDLKK